jgi:hypothetical protein
MTRPNWSRPLPRPIIIPKVMTLTTLADVRKSRRAATARRASRQKHMGRYVGSLLSSAALSAGFSFGHALWTRWRIVFFAANFDFWPLVPISATRNVNLVLYGRDTYETAAHTYVSRSDYAPPLPVAPLF